MFGGGWYGYVDKDLRTLLGERVRDRYNLRYCGDGSFSACRASLWAALKAAVDQLSAAQGPDPTKWRADATAERLRFAPGPALDHDALREQADLPAGAALRALAPTDRAALQVPPPGRSVGAPSPSSRTVQEIPIQGDMIRLGQLLKLSDLADSGADARELLLAGGVTVNGEPETRRGRQLHRGDVVALGEHTALVV